MTIQPLVENAIHHAAEKMLDVCVIRVSGAATVSYTHLDVYKRQEEGAVANRIAFFMAPMPWNMRASPTNGYAPGSYLPKPGACLLYTSA